MPQVTHEAEGDQQFERVVFFTDGVFAIAMTLLIIDVHLPQQVASGQVDIIAVLQKGIVASQVIGFIISFLVISSYWLAHHRHFKYIKRYDNTLIWINLLFLMSIVFIPFVTSVNTNYGYQPGSITLYAASIAITQLLLVLMWLYATDHNRLVDADLDRRFRKYLTVRATAPAVVFILSIPIAFLTSPYMAMAFWSLGVFSHGAIRRIYGYRE